MSEILKKSVSLARERAKKWLELHGAKLGFFLGVSVAITLAFEGGFLFGREQKADPLVVTVPAAPCSAVAGAEAKGVENATDSKMDDTKEAAPVKNQAASVGRSASSSDAGGSGSEACAFVGSRNSDKYHLPKCSWAKRIKPENRICFSSAQDAESKGYKAGCVK